MNSIFHKLLKAVPWFILLCLLTVSDQLSKFFIINEFSDGREVKLLSDIFVIKVVYNYGAAFGMLTNKRWFFIIIAVIVLIGFFFIFFAIPKEKKYLLLKIAIVMLGAGALGNMIDRIYLGYVRDFLYFKLINFPIFNFADILIVVASFLFIFLVCFYYKDSDLKKITFKKDI
ncbi:MAG: signal peptidase II [Lachnospiraceae bacterium]|nr:signal peptidase II [Lachnospiraceae bacterium]